MQFHAIKSTFKKENRILNNRIDQIIVKKSKEDAEKIENFLYSVQTLILKKQILLSLKNKEKAKTKNLARGTQIEEKLSKLADLFLLTEKDMLLDKKNILSQEKLENFIKEYNAVMNEKILEIKKIFYDNEVLLEKNQIKNIFNL